LSAPTEPDPIFSAARKPVLFCFSHLRWNFVFQRPQHLMSRFVRDYRVLYWEEPVEEPGRREASLERRLDSETGVVVATPKLPQGLDGAATEQALRALLRATPEAAGEGIVRWYYTPMMLPFSRGLTAVRTVYDCMDELSNFRFAPPELLSLERELLAAADVVFTGGYSLWEAKRALHANIHPFPSSVDKAHFTAARGALPEPADQARLPRPRLGFYGVIDERLDVGLLAALADAHPEWNLVIVGPVVKIDPATLPRRANLHFLGGKSYAELPAYLAGWDVALMPFAINDATRFISPTKTPEYLAAGRPVVSTAIRDVARHWGDTPGVNVADTAGGFIAGCETVLVLSKTPEAWLPAVDAALADLSWDKTFEAMAALVAASGDDGRVVDLPAKASRPSRPYDYLIVGAGFAGAVLAERLAGGSGKRVLLIDRRPHVGGNAFDHHDEAGLLVHRYGPHIFHTNSTDIADYLSRFTAWRPYEHRVLAEVRGQLVPIPINRTTLNRLYGLDLQNDEAAEAYLRGRAEPTPTIRTSQDVVVSAVGRELYELFFRGYTRKQWGLDPSELDKSVTARVPTRTNTDDRYFTDSFQAMPAAGYTAMFERMLDHPNIEVRTGVDFKDIGPEVRYDHLIFCGPIDEYFGHRFGKLPYRSLRFEHSTLDQERFQPVATVNYPSETVPFTRITEFKQLTGQRHSKTSIVHEFPEAEGDPYYPVPRPENQALFKRYETLAMTTPGVTFVGRLATYRYYNMDQVVGQALTTWRRLTSAASGDAARMAAVTPAA
jgi:UDP-galactopyranose mutase